MYYNDFKELKLSGLGMGNMRLPVLDNDSSKINEELAGRMLAFCLENGINYFDTAYGYHGGNSEIVVGKLLKQYPRDSFYLATKFPSYDASLFTRMPEIFEEQLSKLQVDYFDFYLMHNVNHLNINLFVNPEKNALDYFYEQKEKGRIRHLGFSSHADYDDLKKYLEAYGDHMEFCQIQLNWLDWDFQDAKKRVELLKEYNIPIWVMEPVRGGKLASLPDNYMDQLKPFRPNATSVEWCFRFLQAIPEVTMILSGMSNMEQLEENIKIFETKEPVTEEEKAVLFDIAKDMVNKNTLPCTACRYCTSYCPNNINIPEIIAAYNEDKMGGRDFRVPMLLNRTPEGQKPFDCVACRSCEDVCPQDIKISELMEELTNKFQK